MRAGRAVGGDIVEELVVTRKALARSPVSDFANEGVRHRLVEEGAGARPTERAAQVPASSGKLARAVGNAIVARDIAVDGENPQLLAGAQQVGFAQAETFEGQAMLETDAQIEGRAPLIARVDDDVVAAVRLRHAEYVHLREKIIGAEQPFGFGQQVRVVTVARAEQQLALDHAAARAHMQRIGSFVRPREATIQPRLAGIEDRMVVYEDEGNRAGGAGPLRARR